MDPALLNPSVVAPPAWLGLGAMAVLLGEVFLSRSGRGGPGGPGSGQDVSELRLGTTLAGLALAALVLALYTAGASFVAGVHAPFNPMRPMLQMDPLSSAAMVIVATGAALAVMLSITYLPVLRINHGEYYALVLLSTAGMLVMVCSVDLLSLFMGLELMSIPVYVLAGFDRRKLRSNEAGMKYFLIGAFATALLLYGMALLYGATGHTDFAGIREGFDPESGLAMSGLGLVVAGLAFKISAVPFHQWSPDVYEGAPTSVTAFMSVAVKSAAVVILVRFVALALPESTGALEEAFWWLAALTMVVGNVMAVIQTNVKRLLAYSSIAHAGYLLVGFATGTEAARAAILFYLLAYTFMNLGAFGIVVALARGGREHEKIDDFAGLARVRPVLAGLMTLFVLGLAGIPGTVGFIGKFQLFSAAVAGGLVELAIVGVLASVVSVYYYLRLPVAMYMRDPLDDTAAEASTSEVVVLTLCAVAVLALGLWPNTPTLPLLDWAQAASSAIP